jgi:hypothetical protein
MTLFSCNRHSFPIVDVFHEYLNDFMVYYIDNILIFSKNMEDHEHHVHLVLEKLW